MSLQYVSPCHPVSPKGMSPLLIRALLAACPPETHRAHTYQKRPQISQGLTQISQDQAKNIQNITRVRPNLTQI